MSEYTEEAGEKLDAAMRQLFRDTRKELTPEQREAMGRLLADLRSESESEDGEECQAAYERGKTEERARVAAALEVERNDRLQRMEQEREEEDEERASYYFGLARELGLAIEIVNQE